MPPVGAAIGAAVTGVGASISTALTGAAFSGFAVKAFTQIAIGVAFSAVSRMLMPGQKLASQGVRTSVGFGEDAPAPARVTETASPGAALPVRTSVLSEVTPSDGAPLSSEMARIDGVATAVLTATGADGALVLPARSVAVTVNECAVGGSGGPA